MKTRRQSNMIPRLFMALLLVALGAAALALQAATAEAPVEEIQETETAGQVTQEIVVPDVEPEAEEPENEPETQAEDAEVLLLGVTVEVLPSDDDPPRPSLTDQVLADGLEAGEPETAKTWNGITEGDTIVGTLTYYDICLACCGKTDGVTASGLAITNGMEDPYIVSCNWLPLGTVVAIDGITYTVADRGGTALDTVGRMDVFTPAGHQAALELGRTEGAEITILSFPEGA